MTLTHHSHLLLDLDGTVLDFQASQRDALRRVVDDLGVGWTEEHATAYGAINSEVWEAYERRELEAVDLRTLRWRRFLDVIGVTADPEQVGAAYLDRFRTGAHVVDGAAEAIAALARRMTIVGDSLTSDMAGGRAYGITTIWVDAAGAGHASHPAPDRTVRSIAELV